MIIGLTGRKDRPGYYFSLAGKLWKVVEVDTKHRAVYVKAAKGKVDTLWLGSGGDIHTIVSQKMRECWSARRPTRIFLLKRLPGPYLFICYGSGGQLWRSQSYLT
ncbi:hypothetical protein D3C71_1878430 [compost metagenome]